MISRCDVRAHFGSIATVRSSPHLQGVVRTTDSAIRHVHGLPLTGEGHPLLELLLSELFVVEFQNYLSYRAS
jgi:hypothetical protein